MSETTPARTHSGLFAKNSAVLRLWEGFMDLVFPPMCLHCARVDFHFCPNCQQALREFPLDQQTAAMAPLQSIASSGLHDGVLQAAVQALKYQNMPEIAQPLGQRLALLLSVLDWQVDVIVPVPLHAQRFQVRGYNQAGEIAHHLAEFAEIPFMPEASQRIRYTQTQVGLSREERLQNVVESFSADESMVRGKSVLIVDDVKTTGATLAACAQPMLDAGADTVFALTVTAAT